MNIKHEYKCVNPKGLYNYLIEHKMSFNDIPKQLEKKREEQKQRTLNRIMLDILIKHSKRIEHE